MEYYVHHKGRSLTYEDVINDETVNLILGENAEIPPTLQLTLYYWIPGPSNSKVMKDKKCFLVKTSYYEIFDNGGRLLHREFKHYDTKIKSMFDEIFTEKELMYQKIFPELNLGLPFVIAFEISS